MMRTIRVLALLSLLALVVLTAGACGGSAATATPTAVPTVAEPTATPVPPTEAPATEATEAEAAATEAPAAEAAATEAEAAATEATEAEAAATEAEAPAVESAAPAGAVTVESARPLTAVVNEREVPFAAISPNGAQIAWFNQTGRRADRTGMICLFTFANADKTCHNLPTGAFRDWPYQLQWSPDSTMITFTENPVQLGNDADIWLFTAADGSFQNLTDDGVTGSWRGNADAMLDYLPAWNAADGSIVFWRIQAQEFPTLQSALYKVTPGSEAELVRDLTEAMPQQLPIFQQESFFMDGFSAVSPDGAKLAAIVASFDQFGAIQPNLWVIDLADAAAAPVQVMSFADYQTAIPDWPGIPAAPVGLSWTADSSGLVTVGFSNLGNSTPFMVFYYANPAGGAFSPVVDFSSVEDSSTYFAIAPGSNLPWRAYSPWTGSLAPSGTKLLMLNDLTGSMGLFTSPLPPTSELPTVATAANESLASSVTRSSRADNGMMLMYGLLMTVVEN
jgi:Tol biopolymer transport system component